MTLPPSMLHTVGMELGRRWKCPGLLQKLRFAHLNLGWNWKILFLFIHRRHYIAVEKIPCYATLAHLHRTTATTMCDFRKRSSLPKSEALRRGEAYCMSVVRTHVSSTRNSTVSEHKFRHRRDFHMQWGLVSPCCLPLRDNGVWTSTDDCVSNINLNQRIWWC